LTAIGQAVKGKMMVDSFPVFRAPGRRFDVAMPGQPTPKGAVVGAIVFDDDLFEAFSYARKPGERSLGFCPTIVEALKLFYRTQPVPPHPPLGIITKRMIGGRRTQVDSVQWCGGQRKCDCYHDGLVGEPAHKFRLEHSKIVRRWVKL
jgi:hypothetical protein